MASATLLEPPSGLSQPDVHQPVRLSKLKRKTSSSETCPSDAKRTRSLAAVRKGRGGWRGWRPLERPEEGSLNGRLHAHPREKLFLHPFEWTSRQGELLQLSFRRVEPPSGGQRQRSNGSCGTAELEEYKRPHNASGDDFEHFVKELGSMTIQGQELGVKRLVKLFHMERQWQELRLRYGDKSGSGLEHGTGKDVRLPVGGLYGKPGEGACVAYVCFEEIVGWRRRYAWRNAREDHQRRDKIVAARCRRALREMQPAVAEEDAYIGSLLLAQAQDQWAARQAAGRAAGRLEEEVFAVHAMGLPSKCADKVYFYTAQIPGELLVRLRRPNERVECRRAEILVYSVDMIHAREAAKPLWQILRKHI